MSKQNQILVSSNNLLKNFFDEIEIKELFLIENIQKQMKNFQLIK